MDNTEKGKDPIFLCNDDLKFYFWDETWTEKFGPYDDYAKAREGLDTYVQILNRCKSE
jgi:hypothetical protein